MWEKKRMIGQESAFFWRIRVFVLRDRKCVWGLFKRGDAK
jgi:hypothetical protein